MGRVSSFVVQMFVKAINLKANHNSRAFEDSTQQMHSTSTLLYSDIIEKNNKYNRESNRARGRGRGRERERESMLVTGGISWRGKACQYYHF